MTEPTAFDAATRFDLGGRAALVTGAAHGLGLAIATGFVGTGTAVTIIDVDGDALEVASKLIRGAHADARVHAEALDAREGAAVAYAASFITGQTLVVDGGWVFD